MPEATVYNKSWLHRSKFAYYLSFRSRRRKLQLLLNEMGNDSSKQILDIGAGGEWEYSENILEKYYPYPERIVAVSIEKEVDRLRQKYPTVNWVRADGLRLPFRNKKFDIAVANAVIEHVVGDEPRRQLVKEMLRVARRCFITTPNAWFPIEVHTRLPFVHWLPDKWFNWITKQLGMQMLSKGPGGYFDPITPRQLRSYFPANTEMKLRVGWLGMTLILVCSQERAINTAAQ